MKLNLTSLPWAALALALALPAPARAFCGFYVSGADAELYNDATVVVLMRDGTTTVLSMRNAYEGPPENFAMVVPVPTVIQEEDVHTLPAEVFRRVDALAAPRLVGPGRRGIDDGARARRLHDRAVRVDGSLEQGPGAVGARRNAGRAHLHGARAHL